jgi:hypothetical protein
MASHALRRGDLVEIRSHGEILATLDETGSLDGLPFMPEMIAYCGQRLLVDKIADKLCEYKHYMGSRKLPDAVLLADQRCSGADHGGCQARCRIFWKNVWLRKVAPDDPPAAPSARHHVEALQQLTARYVRREATTEGAERLWRCQVTELFDATIPVSLWNPCVYIGQYTNGNVSLARCARVTARAAIEEPLRKLGLTPPVYTPGTATGPVDDKLDLQPGEWVQVRSKEEILATLTPSGNNRGLWFDREMLQFCGGKFRVEQRISRIIDDMNHVGRLIELRIGAVTLEGVVCSGDYSEYRWLCSREIMPYWRECWLKRVDPPLGA